MNPVTVVVGGCGGGGGAGKNGPTINQMELHGRTPHCLQTPVFFRPEAVFLGGPKGSARETLTLYKEKWNFLIDVGSGRT